MAEGLLSVVHSISTTDRPTFTSLGSVAGAATSFAILLSGRLSNTLDRAFPSLFHRSLFIYLYLHPSSRQYDYDYMDYTVRVLQKCHDFGFKVFMDPHQDTVRVFSSFLFPLLPPLCLVPLRGTRRMRGLSIVLGIALPGIR